MTRRSRPFTVLVHDAGDGVELRVAGQDGAGGCYRLGGLSPAAFADLHRRLAEDFAARTPPAARPAPEAATAAGVVPLLVDNRSDGIFYGYGDPCVVRCEAEDCWYLIATSNDAADAFPILRSTDLHDWSAVGFAFAAGTAPGWTLCGEGSDFWAPELHQTADGWLLCFTARARDGTMGIGLGHAPSPAGPFKAQPEPILGSGVIDSHLVASGKSELFLIWKEDHNGRWPGRLAALLHDQDALVDRLFKDPADRNAARLSAAMWPWVRTLPPMDRFCAHQVLIDAVTDDFAAFRTRLAGLRRYRDRTLEADIDEILAAMTTRILGQPLSPDRRRLVGDPVEVLRNDLSWEAHLIEGPWITRAAGRWHVFYAGNDFSTAHYGIGAGVADHPLGPYEKQAEPLLRSSREWWGPGHPSVAPGTDGRPHLFFHAFLPGRIGYKAFRALLTAPLEFSAEGVRLGR